MMMKRLFLLPLFALLLGACSEELPYTNVDNDGLLQLMQQGVPLYDIRRAEEWRQTGIIEGSRRLTFIDGQGRVMPGFLEKFTRAIGKNDPVLLICRTGNRTSALARHLVEKMGYTKVYNVRNGITRWISENRPLVRR